MNKSKLSDYQYSKYKEYENKCEIRENKIRTIEDYFIYFLMIVVYLIIVFLCAKNLTDNFTTIPTPIKNATEIFNIIILVIGIILLPIILFFTGLGIITVAIINSILTLLKIPKLTKHIYSSCYKQPQRDAYFEKIEIFKKKTKEYEEHISVLEKEYPDIGWMYYKENNPKAYKYFEKAIARCDTNFASDRRLIEMAKRNIEVLRRDRV
jgi:hypothetical protein